jgi:hypothetical protein
MGNSIYFFGRSHEHNIINLAIIFVFAFFIVLDLAGRLLCREGARSEGESAVLARRLPLAAAALFILITVVAYTDNIANKTAIQAGNFLQGRLMYPFNFQADAQFYNYIGEIKGLTGNSSKVYFVDRQDFFYNYYGGYDPVGFCSPFMSWIFVKDQHRFLQGLLDSGYFLVCHKDMLKLLDGLVYSNRVDLGSHSVVVKLPR